jgi:hypothetical protein
MFKKLSLVLCGLAMMASSLPAHADDDKTTITGRMTAASQVIEEIMATPDKSIPGGILAGAKCVVVTSELQEGRICRWRTVWPGSSYLPHTERHVERASVCTADRR